MRRLVILLGLAACDDAGDAAATDARVADAMAFSSLDLTAEGAPTEAPAGTEVALVVHAKLPDGAPAVGLALGAEVVLGGGTATGATTDADGRATVAWTLGSAPVLQRVVISAGPGRAEVTIDATAPDPVPTGAAFGDVPTWLTTQEVAGSTEDLEFWNDALVLGVPGGLIRLDPAGAIEPVALTGDAIQQPLGIAADAVGNLWVADSGARALLRVDPDGAVTTALTAVDDTPLEGPNFVAAGPDGKIYLSDPCLGLLIRFDPATARVDATHPFDRATEGGPNGFAFEGNRLWVVTENTVLVCRQAGLAAPDAPLAGLFRIEMVDEGFGARTTVGTGLGVFGDGLTLDAEGNLYVILDQVANFQLAESAVWVLPAGGDALRKFLVADELLYANLAFGKGNFGEGTLYISLLTVAPFTGPESRGVHRYPVGIPGAP